LNYKCFTLKAATYAKLTLSNKLKVSDETKISIHATLSTRETVKSY